jgi:hypothetical protein
VSSKLRGSALNHAGHEPSRAFKYREWLQPLDQLSLNQPGRRAANAGTMTEALTLRNCSRGFSANDGFSETLGIHVLSLGVTVDDRRIVDIFA